MPPKPTWRAIVKILLLEDDTLIAEQIRDYFELFDHKVICYDNGQTLIDNANPAAYDVMLLDINTPGMNGLDVLRELRAYSVTTPAIFITAMSDLEHLKEAYATGGNDYVRKPFDIEELEIRIRHLVAQKNSDRISITEHYAYDMHQEKLFYKGTEVHLNPKERALIYLLLKHPNEIVSKESIQTYLWEDQPINENTLRTTIKKLRDKLDENFIVSHRGAGYTIAL
jgi:DNA-binding response OmpR family regulator